MNKPVIPFLSAAILAGILLSPSSAAVISDFSSGADGFTAQGFELTHHSSGLGSGGYIELYDNKWGNGVLQLSGNWIGDLSLGGSISFDAMVVSPHESTHEKFGEMTLAGGGFQATLDAISSVPSNTGWERFTVNLDAQSWGLSEVNFSSLLSDLSSFKMILETKRGLGERIAFDNFAFQNAGDSVPVPGAALLLGPALAAGLLRRKAQGAS